MPMYSGGPLPLRGPLAGPAAAGCSLQQSAGLYAESLLTLRVGAKMPPPYNRHTA